ncbi:MAG: hypothetical protein HW386_73 [Gammaproteobacteria bacterium]|nr:hypothetical protein [Gammaproteobacteria bacterium]
MSIWHITQASRYLARGGVIAYPTESVYGLGCNPWEAKAVERILTLKQRDPAKGLIVVAATIEQLEPLVDLTSAVPLATIMNTWPGPVTWVLPEKKGVPVWLRGAQGGIAVRVSAHPLVQALCLAAGLLVSTSANPEGYTPAKTANRVRAYFGNQLDYIVPGPTGRADSPTEIRHAVSGKLLRPSRSGAVTST